MAKHKIFLGFFSYAHHDAETDPGLITALTTALERRVNAKLVNARFEIWRDEERLRIGERWNETIEAILRSANLLIVLPTPSWIGSSIAGRNLLSSRRSTLRAWSENTLPLSSRGLSRLR